MTDFVMFFRDLKNDRVFEKVSLAFLSKGCGHVAERGVCSDHNAFFFAEIDEFGLLEVRMNFDL
jgi:hypothetical protein